ncbi:MAG TPA: DCC1-like thiol-disulfide oxidoreductase family protein [Nitrospiria bacterium]|nr:DCC1-like thiol-disulfide oxidoreductase family protein [Nitrospiria bacterium]
MNSPLILFDETCNLCIGSVIFVIKRDPHKQFKLAPMQSPLGQMLLKDLNFPLDQFKTFVFISEGRYFTKSTAVLMVIKRLKFPWAILYALTIIPKPIRDLIYSLIARNRHRLFGKSEACRVPNPDFKTRIVSSLQDLNR